MAKRIKNNTQPRRQDRVTDSLVVLTADQSAALKRQQVKHQIKGDDFRNHSGARSKVHRNKKKDSQRFDKRDLD